MSRMNDIEITEAAISDKPTLRQLLGLYQYDFSEFEGTDVGPHGVYGYRYLDHYWTEPDRHPYLIRVGGQLAGFALVNRRAVSGEDRWSLAEFFVMRKYRRRGIGGYAATYVFDLWPGKWEVAQVASHPGSSVFWRKVIQRYMRGGFEERQAEWGGQHSPVQLFDNSGHGTAREEGVKW